MTVVALKDQGLIRFVSLSLWLQIPETKTKPFIPKMSFNRFLFIPLICTSLIIPSFSINATDIVIDRAKSKDLNVVFMVGEKEYLTAETLPKYARQHLIPNGVDCNFIHVNPEDSNDFPGLIGALEKADVLVISVRRRTPPINQMNALKKFLNSKKGIVGIRTSSHSFGRVPPNDRHVQWDEFDRDVFGMDYEGHYGNKGPDDHATIVNVIPFWKSHPILKDLKVDNFTSTSHLYRNRDPDDGVSILLSGTVGKDTSKLEPVAWTFSGRKGKTFYTSLGNPDDFEQSEFVQILTNAILWAKE